MAATSASPASRRAPTTGGGPAPTATWSRAFSNDECAGVDWGWSGAPDTSGTNRSCRRRYVETDDHLSDRVYHYDRAARLRGRVGRRQPATRWAIVTSLHATRARRRQRRQTASRRRRGIYDPLELAASATGESSDIQRHLERLHRGARDGQSIVITPTTPANLPIPATAYDLDINLIPTNDADALAADVPGIVYRRTAGSTHDHSGTRWQRGLPGGGAAAAGVDPRQHADLRQRADPDRQHLSRHRHDLGRPAAVERRHLRRQPGHVQRRCRSRATSSS